MRNNGPDSVLRIIIKNGLLGSVVAVYVSAIGMVEAFSLRSLIGDSLSLGYVILAAGPVGAGLLTARALRERTSRRNAFGASLGAGAVSSSLLLVLVAIIVLFVVLPGLAGAEVTLRVMLAKVASLAKGTYSSR